MNKVVLVVCTLLLTGCATAVKETDTVAGSAAAVTGSSQGETNTEATLPRTIALLPFDNSTKNEFAYEVVRHTMANHFSTRNYRMLHVADVDQRLALADVRDIDSASTDELRQILGVDGLIYGEITHYNKTFAGIYAQIAVGVQLKFLNDKDEVVWEVKDVRRSHAGGVSTSPVGLLMNALVAAKHLYGDINLYRAADDLGRDLAKEIPQPEGLSTRAKPSVLNVVHSGVNQWLKYGDRVEFGLEGSPGMQAAVSIEGLGIVDLKEVEPGQYIGETILDVDVNLDGVAVIGRLQDDFGQTTSWVSPYGLLNVDNEAPGAVSALEVVSADGSVRLDWQAPQDDDLQHYQVSITSSETATNGETITSRESKVSLDMPNFDTRFVQIAAVDLAGNVGDVVRQAVTAAPDSRFSSAETVSSDLPMTLSGIARLTVDHSPYFLRRPTRVATDGVLLIEPGVEIQVSQGANLTVLGELRAFGEAERPVKVSGSDAAFDEFLVLQSVRPVMISGLHVSGAGIPIRITAGSPELADCKLTGSVFNGLMLAGSSRPVISNCEISDAGASGVVIEGQSQPEFKDNLFRNNQPFQIQNGSTYQVDLTGNRFEPPASASTILGDVVY